MCSKDEQQEQSRSGNYQEWRLLNELEDLPEVSQRQLAVKMGIALGLTNVLVRRLIQKGYLRVSKATWKRRLYNLTPEGLAHKLQLTKSYITRVLGHYRTVRQILREQMASLGLNSESRIAVYGTDDFTELVYLGLKEIGIEEIDIFSNGDAVDCRFLGMPVNRPSEMNPDDYEIVIIAMLYAPKQLDIELSEMGVPPQKVIRFPSNG